MVEYSGNRSEENNLGLGKGINFLGKSVSEMISNDGVSKTTPPSFQELTLSYLCENSKLGFVSYKGKEVM